MNQYFQPLEVQKIRSTILILLLVFLDFFMMLGLLSDPFNLAYAKVFFFFIVLFHVWGITVCLRPKKWQLHSLLFIGVLGVFISFGFIVLVHRIVYQMLGFDAVWYGVTLITTYLLFISLFIRWLFLWYNQRDFRQAGWFLGMTGAASIIIPNLLIWKIMGYYELIVLVACFHVFSLCFVFVTMNIHRYFCIKKGMK